MEKKTDSRIARLTKHHRKLDEQVRVLMQRPWLTPAERNLAQTLKRRRLHTKDRLARLAGSR